MSELEFPSPAVAFVGRHNSGKTTLIEKLIAELTRTGVNVGSVKHHSHSKFEIDYPGKDSYRHRAAGAVDTIIASPEKLARIKTLTHEMECSEIVRQMPGHDIVVVEGYRKSGLPTIELMRAGNEADQRVADAFLAAAKAGVGLGADNVQAARAGEPAPEYMSPEDDLLRKMPGAQTVAVVTDIPQALEAAQIYNLPTFDVNDIAGVADYVRRAHCRPKVTVVVQAGGESRRMGRSKATVPFGGKPLISRLVNRLAPAADEMIITTNEPENLGFLPALCPDTNVRLVRDTFDFRGALPGLHTALTAASNPCVAVVACDMVFASAKLVAAEALEMVSTGADVVVPSNEHGYEPFHSMYRRDACLPAIERAIAAGERRAQVFFDDPDVTVCEFPQSKVLEVEPKGWCFVNTNTPEELAKMEQLVFS
jgi:molybdopterin-guanine dinucleotide biosynthesis protein MobB